MSTTDAQAVLDQVYGNTTSLQTAMEGALSDLSAVAHGSFLDYFNISSIPAPDISAPAAVTLGVMPVMKKMDFSGSTPTPRAPFSNNAPQFQAPTMDAPGAEFVFDESLINEVEAQFSAIIQSGGSNISTAIQQAVFDQGYERNRQILSDALDLAGARTGAKGCRYPNSMTKAMQQQILTEYAWQRNDMSRQITKAFADLLQANLQTAMSAGLNMAAVKADLEGKIKTLSYEAQRLALERYKTQIESNYNVWKGQLEAILANFQVEKTNYELTLDYQAAQREYMRLQAQENIAEFDAANKNQLTQLEADKIIQQLQQEYERTLVERFRVASGALLEQGKAQVQQVMEENKIRSDAIESLAKSYIGIAQTMSSQGVAIVTKKT